MCVCLYVYVYVCVCEICANLRVRIVYEFLLCMDLEQRGYRRAAERAFIVGQPILTHRAEAQMVAGLNKNNARIFETDAAVVFLLVDDARVLCCPHLCVCVVCVCVCVCVCVRMCVCV